MSSNRSGCARETITSSKSKALKASAENIFRSFEDGTVVTIAHGQQGCLESAKW